MTSDLIGKVTSDNGTEKGPGRRDGEDQGSIGRRQGEVSQVSGTRAGCWVWQVLESVYKELHAQTPANISRIITEEAPKGGEYAHEVRLGSDRRFIAVGIRRLDKSSASHGGGC